MFVSLLLTILYYVSGVLSDSNNIPCKFGDHPCLENVFLAKRTQVINGIPELGIEGSEPLKIKEIEGKLSELNYKFFNNTFNGYKDCVLSNLNIKTDITGITYDLTCPKITIRGQYKIKGNLLTMPIEGSGDFEIITGKYLVHVVYEWEKYKGEDGKYHLGVANIKLKPIPQGQISFDLKNLFNGQKDKADAVLKFAHDNWRQVAELIQEPIWTAAVNNFMINVNKFLSTVPLDSFITF